MRITDKRIDNIIKLHIALITLLNFILHNLGGI
jgi:hypothetical protein